MVKGLHLFYLTCSILHCFSFTHSHQYQSFHTACMTHRVQVWVQSKPLTPRLVDDHSTYLNSHSGQDLSFSTSMKRQNCLLSDWRILFSTMFYFSHSRHNFLILFSRSYSVEEMQYVCPHLHGPPGFFDHELQSSEHGLCGAAGIHVRITVVRVVKRNHHRLVSRQLEETNRWRSDRQGICSHHHHHGRNMWLCVRCGTRNLHHWSR